MSETSINSYSNQTAIHVPAWSFMALHCKTPSSTSSTNPSDGTQEGLVFGKHLRLKSSRINPNAEDVAESKLQSSKDRLHILDSPFTQPPLGVGFHGEKSAGVVRLGEMSFSSDSLASTSSYPVRDNTLDTAGLFSYSSEQTKGYLRHNASAASRLGPESPAAEDSEYINDKHTPRVLSTIPYSSEDVDSKIDTAETIPTGKRDAMSSDDFHGCRSQNKLQTRSVSMSNNHLTDQNGMHTLVLEAMKTIQKFELENEQQRQDLNRLGTVILDLQSEKQRLVDKVTTLKKTSIQKIAACSQALKDQGEELRSLKLKSEELFATTPGECRALLQEIHQLKDTISESIESVQEYLNPEHCTNMRDIDHILPSGPATREILSVLKNEVHNKQQVLDMLRDRLSDALSDVAVLRSHAFQMQEAYSAECLALKVAKEERDMRDTRIAVLLDELNNQRTESVKALAQAAELELKYQSQQQQHLEQESLQRKLQVEVDLRLQAEKRVIEQDAIFQTQKTSLEFLENIKNENFQLSSDLASRTERLKLLDASQTMVKTLSDENENLRNEAILRDLTIREYEVKLASLETVSAKCEKEREEEKSTIIELRDVTKSNERVISELKNSVLNYQEKVSRIECLLTQAKEELSTSLNKAAVITESEKALQTRCLEVTKEKEALSLRLQETSQKLEQVLTSKDQEIKTEIHSRLKSVQEQFEDQNTTLRLVREANADLQERLMSVVADHTKKLEETRGNFRRDMAILEERNSSLHSQLEREKESVSGLQARLSQKDLEIEKHLKESKQRSESFYLRLHQDLQSLQEQKSSLEIQLHQEKATYQAQYSDFQIKEAERLREINELHTDMDLRTQYELEMKERHDREQFDSRSQIELLQTRLSDLDKKSNSLPFDCFEHEQEIHRLRAHVHQIQAENDMVRDRMITLSLRYDSGDLDVGERTLVQKIMKGIQAVHDQEIAKLKNELHRKDGLIASLEDIKTTLENSLRKKLQKKSPLAGTNTFETSEFINWPSSPPVYPALTTHLERQIDELTKTPPGERQDGALLYSAPRQPINKNNPLNTAPISTAPQDSNDNLALGDLATPGSTSGTIALDTQRPPKRPKTAGRNTQTYSSKNKRKRRN